MQNPASTDRPKGPIHLRIPEGEDRLRRVCDDCGFIHYDNPKIVVGAVVTVGERYLLCRRAIDPRSGFWTIPAGYLELNESPMDGARREAMEEACCHIAIDRLLAVYDVPRISQVQLIYRAELVGDAFGAGPESLEVKLFTWNEIPWDELAFPSVHWGLTQHRSVIGKSDFAPFVNGGPQK